MKLNATYPILLLTFVLATLAVDAQQISTRVKAHITPYHLGIAFDKSTNLIFPYSIRGVDRGSADVMVQKAKGADNILQVKAGARDFLPTNLTVITGEGALYSFLLSYNPNPALLNLNIAELSLPVEQVAILNGDKNEAALRSVSKRIAVKRKMMNGPRQERFGIRVAVQGIYIHSGTLYLQLEFRNDTRIDYDVSQFRLAFKDRKKSKRTASQELAVTPLYVEGNIGRIAGMSCHTAVVALDKFTIPDQKKLVIQLMEANGGRHLEIELKNRHLIKARRI